jgi:hypothetical protein
MESLEEALFSSGPGGASQPVGELRMGILLATARHEGMEFRTISSV